MDRSQLTTLLAEIIAAATGLEVHSLREGDRLHEVVQLDSLDVISIAVELHERTAITIEVAEVPGLVTVGDFVDLLVKKHALGHNPAQAA